MTMKPKLLSLLMMCVISNLSHSAVSADEAAALNKTLTPLGAEKAGNKDGSIPVWDGGMTKMPAGPKRGDIPADLFPGEKPLMQISSKNSAKYADKLSDGTKALLLKYPDSFRIDVYPTHRTAAASQWVYDNTLKNATNCKIVDNGASVEGCYGGIPFPIPKSGAEVIWNFLLRVEPESLSYAFRNIVGSSDGSHTMATRNEIWFQYPYYYKDGSAAKWMGEYLLERFNTTAPPFKAGESLVFRDSINPKEPRQAWQYLVGQRRVRRAPTVGYDTPDFVASGANYFDEVQGFLGDPGHFQWKIIGKQELYVPYNDNSLINAKLDDALGKSHYNPDKLRWELHRVWVVEANVAPGKRHAVPKRRFYFDEDTWIAVMIDGYDAEGKLWRTSQITPFVVPSVPATLIKPALVFNLQAGTMSGIQLLNDETYRIVPRKPEKFFTGDAVAADAAQ